MTLSTKLNHLPPVTPLTSADTMRSVQIEASTHHHLRARVSVSCLALSGTAETVPCSIPALAPPASCPPSLGAVLLPAPSTARCGIGTMKALTPVHLTLTDRALRLPRLAVPTFRPQPRGLSYGRFVSRLTATGCFQASPHMSRLATASRRNRFVTLRTASSPPVAPHPVSRRRSYLRLRSLRPAPARTFTVLTKRPRGRTHADAEPAPSEGRGRHPRLAELDERKTWMPTCVGMTALSVRDPSEAIICPWALKGRGSPSLRMMMFSRSGPGSSIPSRLLS
jgi:hypothetical protein